MITWIFFAILASAIPFTGVSEPSTLFMFLPAFAQTTTESECTIYDPAVRLITIRCGSASLTDISLAINDTSVLKAEQDNGVWLLNASLRIDQDATIHINSTDTRWLKLSSDIITPAISNNVTTGNDTVPYGIEILGNARIDSVRITSWDPSTDSHMQIDDEGRILRPYILLPPPGTGSTNITNSEIAYLGSAVDMKQGLSYFSGDGSILKNNTIHHMWFGFYSVSVGGMIIEDSLIHSNARYGLDPHTGTHDMVIRNNVVRDNGHIGIICSIDCERITIAENIVSNNTGAGIMLSKNAQESIVANNTATEEDKGIVISESSNNKAHNNKISGTRNGIEVKFNSSSNTIHDNHVTNSSDCGVLVDDNTTRNNMISYNSIVTSSYGICVFDGTSENTIRSNTLANASTFGIYVRQPGTVDNMFQDNILRDSASAIRLVDSGGAVFINNTIIDNKEMDQNNANYSITDNSTLRLHDTTFASDVIRSVNGTNMVIIRNSDWTPIKNDLNVINIMNSTGTALSFRLEAGEQASLTTLAPVASP